MSGKDLEVKKQSDIQIALMNVMQNKDIDPDRLEKFLDLQIKMEDRQAKRSFSEALAGFQGDCPIIKKIKKIDFSAGSGNKVKYNYSPLDEIVYVIKPHLKTWGLSFSFNIKKSDQDHELLTTVRHSAGYSEETSYFFPPLHDDKRMNQSQRAKSAITYAKRAALENALGLVTAEEDDDARRALDLPITEEQIKQIESLIKSTKTETSKFLEFIKAEKLEDLSEFEAKRAIHALTQKRAK